MPTLDDATLRQLFLDARTHIAWQSRPVDDAVLRRVYELARMGPTAMNIQPLRLVFVKSAAAKERLRPALPAGNVEKAMTAAATAIVAWDSEFFGKLNRLAPHRPDAGARMAEMPADKRERMGVQSATLQAGYLILAARSLGLDCGPMGGFDAPTVDAAFFAGTTWRSMLLVNLGYGDAAKLNPRAPRLEADEACRIE